MQKSLPRFLKSTYTGKHFRRLMFASQPKIRRSLKNQFICVINQNALKDIFFHCKLINPSTVFFIDKDFLCTWNRYILKLTVVYVSRRNPLLYVYLLQVHKKCLSMKETVEGFISLQRKKIPLRAF